MMVRRIRRPRRTCPVRRWRRTIRTTVRALAGFNPRPHPLAQMIRCHRRAIRAYRRLAKLAPRHFDPAVVNRADAERAIQRRWMSKWDEATEKAYGPITPEEREARRRADALRDQPPPLHPRTQRAVELQKASFLLWRAAGEGAKAEWEEFQYRRPHDHPTWNQLLQLTKISFDFRWIATGFDWRHPAPEQPPLPTEDDFEADLRRAYGHQRSIPHVALPESNPIEPQNSEKSTCPLETSEPKSVSEPAAPPPSLPASAPEPQPMPVTTDPSPPVTSELPVTGEPPPPPSLAPAPGRIPEQFKRVRRQQAAASFAYHQQKRPRY